MISNVIFADIILGLLFVFFKRTFMFNIKRPYVQQIALQSKI